MLTRLNRYQRAAANETLFSVIYAMVDPSRGKVVWASGGHPPPLVRTASGEIRILRGGGALIGFADDDYEEGEALLSGCDTLILFSDGLVERRCESLDVGLQRLSTAAASGPHQASALCEHLLRRMLLPTQELQDDVTRDPRRGPERAVGLTRAEARTTRALSRCGFPSGLIRRR